MVQHKKQHDDEIDLIELFLIFWKHKIVFASLMVIGLVLGLAISSQKTNVYMTKFHVVLGHPGYDSSMLMFSTDFQTLLRHHSLYPNELPSIRHITHETTKNSAFEVKSSSPDVQEEIKMNFTEMIAKELERQKYMAEISKKAKMTYIRDSNNRMSDRVFISGLTEYISQTPTTEILKELRIVFGPTIKIQPNVFKYGFYGIFVGLFFSMCWIALSGFYQAIQKKILLKR